MTVSPNADSGRVIECARQLRLIANDLRTAGDMRLVRLSEDGISNADISLADELWLVALRLDPDRAFDDSQGPDALPPNGSRGAGR